MIYFFSFWRVLLLSRILQVMFFSFEVGLCELPSAVNILHGDYATRQANAEVLFVSSLVKPEIQYITYPPPLLVDFIYWSHINNFRYSVNSVNRQCGIL